MNSPRSLAELGLTTWKELPHYNITGWISTSPEQSIPITWKKCYRVILLISYSNICNNLDYAPNHWFSGHRASHKSPSVNVDIPENIQAGVPVLSDFVAPRCPAHHEDSSVHTLPGSVEQLHTQPDGSDSYVRNANALVPTRCQPATRASPRGTIWSSLATYCADLVISSLHSYFMLGPRHKERTVPAQRQLSCDAETQSESIQCPNVR